MSKRDTKKSAARQRRQREQRRGAGGRGLPRQLEQVSALLKEGELEEARNRLEELARYHPTEADVFVLLTSVCVSLEDTAAAREACERLTQIDPDNAESELM